MGVRETLEAKEAAEGKDRVKVIPLRTAYKHAAAHIPVMFLDDCGEELHLLVADLMWVSYRRADAESLARRLEAAAAMVRENS